MSIHDKDTDSIQPELVVDDEKADVEVQNQQDFPIFIAEHHKLVEPGEVVKVLAATAERLQRLGVFSRDVDSDLARERAEGRERSARGEIQGGVVQREVTQRGQQTGVEQTRQPVTEQRQARRPLVEQEGGTVADK